MAITEVGSGSQRAEGVLAGTSSGSAVFPDPVTAGNTIVVGGSFWNGYLPVVTDDLGTVYDVYTTDAGHWAWIAVGVAPSSGANEVYVNTAGSTYGYFSIDEFSGVGEVDVVGTEFSGNANPITAEITTIEDDTLILAAMWVAATASITPASGWIEIGEHESGFDVWPYSFVFKIASSAGLYIPEWVSGAETTGDWEALAISLQSSGGGAPAPNSNFFGFM